MSIHDLPAVNATLKPLSVALTAGRSWMLMVRSPIGGRLR